MKKDVFNLRSEKFLKIQKTHCVSEISRPARWHRQTYGFHSDGELDKTTLNILKTFSRTGHRLEYGLFPLPYLLSSDLPPLEVWDKLYLSTWTNRKGNSKHFDLVGSVGTCHSLQDQTGTYNDESWQTHGPETPISSPIWLYPRRKDPRTSGPLQVVYNTSISSLPNRDSCLPLTLLFHVSRYPVKRIRPPNSFRRDSKKLRSPSPLSLINLPELPSSLKVRLSCRYFWNTVFSCTTQDL